MKHSDSVLPKISEFLSRGVGQGFLTPEGVDQYQKLLNKDSESLKSEIPDLDEKIG